MPHDRLTKPDRTILPDSTANKRWNILVGCRPRAATMPGDSFPSGCQGFRTIGPCGIEDQTAAMLYKRSGNPGAVGFSRSAQCGWRRDTEVGLTPRRCSRTRPRAFCGGRQGPSRFVSIVRSCLCPSIYIEILSSRYSVITLHKNHLRIENLIWNSSPL